MEINCRILCDRSFFFFQSSFFWREVDLTNKRLVRSHEGSGGGGPTAARYFSRNTWVTWPQRKIKKKKSLFGVGWLRRHGKACRGIRLRGKAARQGSEARALRMNVGTFPPFAYFLHYYPLYLLKVLRYLDAYIVKFADEDLIRKWRGIKSRT